MSGAATSSFLIFLGIVAVGFGSFFSATPLQAQTASDTTSFCRDIFAPADTSHGWGAIVVAPVGGYSKEIQEHIERATPPGVELKRYQHAASMWIRDWHPLIRKNPDTGELEFISFRPTNWNGEDAAIEIARVLTKFGIKQRKFPIFLDGGNILMSEKEVLISNSRNLRDNYFALRHSFEFVQNTIEQALGKNVVWLPELPREGTGHVDVFVSDLGRNRFMVSDSREPKRKAALDSAAEILQQRGYEVHRVMNAFDDKRDTPLTYTNALIIGDRVLLPTYGSYLETGSFRKTTLRWAARLKLRSAEKKQADLEQARQSVIEDDLNAIRAYEALGFKVYPIPMNRIVDLHGMVHCLTHMLPKEIIDLLPEALWDSKYR